MKADRATMRLFELPFLEGADAFLDVPLRPVSLGTLLVCDVMESGLYGSGPQPALDSAEAALQAGAFIWAHSAPLEDVKYHVRRGTWREQFAQFEASPTITAALLGHLRRVHDQLGAIRANEKRGTDKPATGHEDPLWLARRLLNIAHHTGWSRDFILWEMPLGEALEYEQILAGSARDPDAPDLAPLIERVEAMTAAMEAGADDGEI